MIKSCSFLMHMMMKLTATTTINKSDFDLPQDQLEVKYGLPKEIKFCSKCNISNQEPMSTNEFENTKETLKVTMQFDADNVCRACRFHELKRNQVINWEEREEELQELCNRFRKNDGSYDCIVGGSGGKDGAMQSHLLKYKYGMHPLTVTWSPHLYTDIGWKNFQNWLHVGGFDNFLYTPNGYIHGLCLCILTSGEMWPPPVSRRSRLVSSNRGKHIKQNYLLRFEKTAKQHKKKKEGSKEGRRRSIRRRSRRRRRGRSRRGRSRRSRRGGRRRRRKSQSSGLLLARLPIVVCA